MRLYDTIVLAIMNIKYNKVRSLLTVLSMVIGVSSVIIISGLGNGAKQYVANTFSLLGTRTMTVMLPENTTSKGITSADMYRIVADNPEIFDRISPIINVKQEKIFHNTESKLSQALGVSEDATSIEGYKINNGRPICYIDILNRHQVCLIGDYISSTFFNGSGVGRTIQIGGTSFTVIGTLEKKTKTSEAGDANDVIYLPYTTALKLWGGEYEADYFITVNEGIPIEEAKQLVQSIFIKKYCCEDVNIITQSQIIETLNKTVSMIVIVLSAVAGISLFVGGIGIMNIMLVTVAERTKEIGIRKAIGAKESEIELQFVVEAGTISTIGGFLGIGLGFFISALASIFLSVYFDYSFIVKATIGAVLLSLTIAVGTGMIFGVLPAKKAARLDPIEALRFS